MSETERRRSRKLLVSALVLAALVAADTVVWSIACQRLDTGAHDAADAVGWSLSADPARWRGWPIAAEIVLPNAVLRSGPDILPPLVWTAGSQTLRLGPLHPTRLTLSAAGPQSVTVADAPPVPFTAGTLVATLDLTQHDPTHVDATDLAIAAAPGRPVHIAAAHLETRPDGSTLRLSTVTLVDSDHRPVEPPIDSLSLTARLSAPIVPMPTATESARRWRAADGRLVIDDAALNWGPLAATGTATLTLDPSLQPALTGRIAATGLPAVLDRLAATSAITASAATAARGMLAILSAPTGAGPLSLPIALQDGIVSLARIPLLRLAPLQWD